MKIAIVINTCWNVYNFRKGLIEFFLSRGDEVIALTPKDEYVPDVEKWGVRHIETKLDQTGMNPVKDLVYFNRLLGIFREEQPHVVLSFTIKSNIYSSLAGRLARVPVICNVSGLGTVFLVKGLFGKIAIGLYRLAFRFSSHIFFQNSDDKELFRTYVSIDGNRIGVLPGSGIDLDKFNFNQVAISKPTKFLMIARLIEEKGVRDFAEAARILKSEKVDATFTLVGALDEGHARSVPKDELDEWINEGIVNYFPHSSEIERLITESEVVVLPSYREGTPRTLLEGAAKGRALLASDVPGCREVVRDGFNGFLFEVKNPEDLAGKASAYIALSGAEKLEMAANSRKIAEEKFDENLVIDTYVETIAQIVEK